MSRTREEILWDIEHFTKRAERCTEWAEYDAEEAEICTKWAEEAKQELKAFDKKEKSE